MGIGAGYDPSFLPVDVPLPTPSTAHGAVVELSYTHFTVLLRPDRRLAVATAVNIDGGGLLDLERQGVDWRLDPRIEPALQAGDELYADNDLDRGHLVRRRDPVWGDPEVASAANEDTFHFTNAAPQVAAFNQSKDLWLGLEDYVLEHAEVTGARLTVLTAPVLAVDDPVYRGVPVPRRFWKVAAWVTDDDLAATGYLLDQTALLDTVLREGGRGRPGDLGAYRTFQVPIADIEAEAALSLGPLAGADRLTTARTGAPRLRAPVELTALGDMVL